MIKMTRTVTMVAAAFMAVATPVVAAAAQASQPVGASMISAIDSVVPTGVRKARVHRENEGFVPLLTILLFVVIAAGTITAVVEVADSNSP